MEFVDIGYNGYRRYAVDARWDIRANEIYFIGQNTILNLNTNTIRHETPDPRSEAWLRTRGVTR